MITEYKYIHFMLVGETAKNGKTHWSCFNNSSNGFLGEVKWYAPWRQYCFFPSGDCVFNVGCMQDICHFIGQLKG